MAKAYRVIPTWVAVINGQECEVANAIYEHYLKAAGGDPEKLPIEFRKTGEIRIEYNDSLAYAHAHLGGDPDDRR